MAGDEFDPTVYDTNTTADMIKLSKLLTAASQALRLDPNAKGAWTEGQIDNLVTLVTHSHALFDVARLRLSVLRHPLVSSSQLF